MSEENIEKIPFNFQDIYESNKAIITFGLVGLILVGIGLLVFLSFRSKEPEIEVITAEKSKNILVHLDGSVEKPGVYELLGDSRLNDLLIRAGGLAAKADRQWVSENLNLAQKLVDGEKIYIPERSEILQNPPASGEGGQVKTVLKKININKASLSELDNLTGIGQKRAEDIVKNRPYSTVEDLLTKKVISQGIYEKIKNEITVY
ncbi:MAG: helix-hairpin-helix domain-containing protein [Candidatus Shapirobacteria bacterium]|nr:helix-hairpin-helix domain-containing protein [Candidatus Shapirobacteria bacterium]